MTRSRVLKKLLLIPAGLTFSLAFSLSSALVLAAEPAGSLSARVGEIVTTRCSLCHGANGESASAVYPRLAAQHPVYLAKQLKDFRDGRRKSDTMSEMAKGLTDSDVIELADYFSTKKAGGRQPGDLDLAGVGKYIFQRGNSFSGVPACVSCHGANGAGTESLPRLAGQHPAYLETQLKEFVKRERTNDNAVMHAVAAKLTELEIRAVAVHLGGLQ